MRRNIWNILQAKKWWRRRRKRRRRGAQLYIRIQRTNERKKYMKNPAVCMHECLVRSLSAFFFIYFSALQYTAIRCVWFFFFFLNSIGRRSRSHRRRWWNSLFFFFLSVVDVVVCNLYDFCVNYFVFFHSHLANSWFSPFGCFFFSCLPLNIDTKLKIFNFQQNNNRVNYEYSNREYSKWETI